MKRGGFFPACLAAAAALHAAPFLAMREGSTIAAGTGSSGSGQVTLVAASTALTQRVSDWNRPPQLHTSTPAMPPTENARQSVPAPVITSAPSAPTAVSSPALAAAGVADTAPALQKSPPPPSLPAAVISAPASSSESVQVQEKAVGRSQSEVKGDGGADVASTGVANRTANLKDRWGAAIISRVERQKRSPRGGGEGTVRLHLTVSTRGRLIAVSVTRSSGIAMIDQAAVRAVQKARMPRAPRALAPGTYRFTFRTTFTD